jgi:uncharacterized membrane protein YfcA
VSGFVLLAVLAVVVVAFLYSSVGHAGASGYIAVLTLLGYSVVVVRPTALLLNVLVASIATWQFRRAGHFSWSLFWPFAIPSVPMAFLGGYARLPATYLGVLVGWCCSRRQSASPGAPLPSRACIPCGDPWRCSSAGESASCRA